MFRILLFLSLLGLPAVLRAQGPADTMPVVRRIAPAEIGSIVRQEKGRVVLLNIWASWCKPCMEEMPGLLELKHKLKDRDFTLLLMSDDDAETVDSLVRPVLRKFGVAFPTYNLGGTDDEALIDAVDSTWSGALPASFLYAPDGKLSVRMVGGKSKAEFEKAVRKLLP